MALPGVTCGPITLPEPTVAFQSATCLLPDTSLLKGVGSEL